MRHIFFYLFLLSGSLLAQKTDSINTPSGQDEVVRNMGAKDSMKIFKPTIEDYRHFYEYTKSKSIDTVFTQEKTHIFTQYNNQDNFGRIQFSNIGAGYNPLTFEHNRMANLSVLPTNKAYFLLPADKVLYYDVKTPTTSFIYHNGMNNGVALTTTYTQNIRKDFNISIQYMGLRSQGNYSQQLAASNSVLLSSHFLSKNGKYRLFAHFLDQNVRNQENGGIQDDELFFSGAQTVNNRENLLVNLSNANTRFALRRYYFSHQFSPFTNPKIPFIIRHAFSYQTHKYYYGEPSVQSFYYNNTSQLLDGYPTNTGKYSQNLSNTFWLVWNNPSFMLNAGVRHQWLHFGVADELSLGGIQVPSQVSEQRVGAVGTLGIRLWDKFDLHSSAEISRGSTLGNFISAENTLRFEPFKGYITKAHLNFQSVYPSLNFVINASPYKAHSYHNTHFSQQNILSIGGSVSVPWYRGNLFGNYHRVGNYTYLNEEGIPHQSADQLSIAELGGEITFQYRKFFLNTRVQFQRVLSSASLLPLPNVIGRANLYYQSKIFHRDAEIQGGIKTTYFNTFASREYFPLLNEFQLPRANAFSIGGKPIIDAYLNMKVKRMFFFVEGQNMLSLIQRNTLYTAPHYPFYDFRINLGIVWYMLN